MSGGIDGLIEEGAAFEKLSAAASTAASRRHRASQDRRFHTGMAVAFLVTALAGFGPSYYAKSVAPTALLTPLIQLHAAVFTGWLLLLLTQTSLVAAHRVTWHQRLGIAGAALAALMVPVGFMTAVERATRLGTTRFLVFQLGAIVLFAVFIGAALWKRKRPELHRRLIMLATISLIPPAIARMPVIGTRPVVAVLLSMLFVVAAIVHDLRSRGRVHPAYVWGGVVLLLSAPLRFALGQTSAWQSFARFLVE